ncbi:hypothetical protein BpHYR1_000142 [Brachionus plicatilis]|uniref:Endonuclease/exonuclease/phosphatase domain-containing protein n=1 Tax=Brachionus plicatilis TaxID=10195 RepID=A0A3M7SDA0_BRAPC|nr:hypothetical protein BpHYR1_000142 [Brachionus plicatilis]
MLKKILKIVTDDCDILANHTYLDDKEMVEFSLFQLKSSSPKSRQSIYIILCTSIQYVNVLSTSTLLVIGDFNVDLNKEKEKSKLDKLIDMDLQPLFKNRATFEKGSQLDWAFVRLSPIDADDQQVQIKGKVLER